MGPTTRRSVLLGALSAPFALSACSDPGEGPSTAGSAAAGDTAGDAVAIEHAFGTTEVSGTPERVVALGVTDLDPLVALGVVPIAAAAYPFFDGSPVGPWAEQGVGGAEVELITSDSDVNVEQIAAMVPDLIIAISSGITQQTYDLLAQVAPTIARPAGTEPYTATREEATLLVARALGQDERGQELVAAADAAFAGATAAHPEFEGATGTVVLPFDGVYGAYTPEDTRGQFMAQLGFSLPTQLAEQADGTFFVEVSRENLNQLEGDVLVALVDEDTVDVVTDDEVLQSLEVVRRGALVVTDGDVRGALTYNTVLSVPYALDALTPQLAQAVAASA